MRSADASRCELLAWKTSSIMHAHNTLSDHQLFFARSTLSPIRGGAGDQNCAAERSNHCPSTAFHFCKRTDHSPVSVVRCQGGRTGTGVRPKSLKPSCRDTPAGEATPAGTADVKSYVEIKKQHMRRTCGRHSTATDRGDFCKTSSAAQLARVHTCNSVYMWGLCHVGFMSLYHVHWFRERCEALVVLRARASTFVHSRAKVCMISV